MIQKNQYGSKHVNGSPSLGCQLCWPGAKLVLFIGGRCNQSCFYCPISEEKKGKDQAYANERPINSDEDLLTECAEMDARGASITGGEPLLYLDRCVYYIKLLKKKFGKRFHIHLYTFGDLADAQAIRKLEEAGLDEIRFHLLNNFERIFPALKSKIKTGVEVPVLPNQEKELKALIDFCAEQKVAFVNLNELEFSDSNYEDLEEKGFEQLGDFEYGVKGSKELAEKILKYAEKYPHLPVHFCPLFIKTRVQLENRLKRRAKNIKKPFEKITETGMIQKGVVEGDEKILRKISEEHKNVFYHEKKKRIETSVQNAKALARKYKKYKLKAWEVLEYPIYEPWDFEKSPL